MACELLRRGVGSVYVSHYPDLAVPCSVETVGSFANLAVKSGVPRLVLLAGRDEPEAERAEQGVLGEVIDLLTYLFSEVLPHNDYLGDGVQRALGREPRDFADYARDAAATGV